MTVRVLVVEDEEVAAEAHAAYVGRGRRVRGGRRRPLGRRGGCASWRPTERVDLVLLDMHLPDGHGLGLLQRLRAAGHLCDVIAVTSARDADVVRHAVAQGVVLYLLKPFTFATFRAKLEQYAAYRADAGRHRPRGRAGRGRPAARLAAPPARRQLPKGMSAETLRRSSTRCGPPTPRCRPPRWPRGSAPRGSPPGATSSTSPTPARSSGTAVRRQRPARDGVPLVRLSYRSRDRANS